MSGKECSTTFPSGYNINTQKESPVNDMIHNFRKVQKSKNTRVLIIEGNTINQMIIFDMLKLLGINRVTVVSCCKDGIDQLQSQKFNIVLINLLTPWAIEYIKEAQMTGNSEVSIIPMTSCMQCCAVQKCTEIGICDFASIPVSFKEFIFVLNKYLE
jgi:DNA-binding NtrC family response regulator